MLWKSVTSKDDIKAITDVINGISTVGEATEEDIVAGGIGLYLQIELSNGEEVIVHIGENGDVFTAGGIAYRIYTIDVDTLWSSLDEKEIPVGEEGLPVTTRF